MQDSKKTPFHAYVSPTPGEITLFASGIVADKVFLIDKEIFSELLACNFNPASITCTIDPTSIPAESPLIRAFVEDSSAGCLISLLQ